MARRLQLDGGMRFLAALVLLVHGLAHLVGFVAALGLSDEIPALTSLLGGRVVLSEPAARIVGAAWLLVALGFAVVAVAVARRRAWSLDGVLVVALASAVLCVLGWPEASIGLAVDAAIVVGALARRPPAPP